MASDEGRARADQSLLFGIDGLEGLPKARAIGRVDGDQRAELMIAAEDDAIAPHRCDVAGIEALGTLTAPQFRHGGLLVVQL